MKDNKRDEFGYPKNFRTSNPGCKTVMINDKAVNFWAINKNDTEEVLIEAIRDMRSVRSVNHQPHGLTISGFDDDKRELSEIPEVQELCKTLVRIGLISELYLITQIETIENYEILKGAFGATEIYALSMGFLNKKGVPLMSEWWDEFKEVLFESNKICDARFALTDN